MIEIKVPELGESITEGTVSAWIKKEGEPVSQGEVIAEIETDKVNLEVSAEVDGVLKKIWKEEGSNVEIGEVIATVDETGKTAASGASSGEPVMQPTDQPKAEPSSPMQEQQKPQNEKQMEKADEEAAHARETKAEADKTGRRRVEATPAARKLAREKGKNLSDIQASDPIGRVRPVDLENTNGNRLAQIPKQPAEKQPAMKAQTPSVPFWDGEPKEERIHMSRRRQTIAKRLVEAQQTAAILTTFNEIDMSAVMNLRSRRKEEFMKEHGIKLGFMSFFTKAVVGALKAFPMLNAEIDGDEIIVKKYYDIGIAVAAKEGLVVPVVRDADRLSFAGIEKEIDRLAKKAVSNELTLADLKGGTFTITNGGVFGSLLSTPIINAPQVGILGMHSIQTRPVAVDEEKMENRPMMYVALSYDHRIVDGKEAVQFLVKIKNLLEDPETLLLEG